jgi:crotonobetainyl-CoA:carnitine CoA-transferase CaiB-like acyl-CoA transferase
MGPLAGIKVLDLSRILAGPWATQLLADLGAEVIKVERPEGGDDTRHWGPPYLRNLDGCETGESAYFLSTNRGKRSVAIDFSTEDGSRLVRELALQSDVLIENYKVGGLEKYRLAWKDLAPLHPGLIYCSISAFGQSGPAATSPGYDAMIQAMGGLMSVTGIPDEEPGGGPQKVGVAVADLLAGMYASTAILAALYERERSGRGQYIDLALLDTQVAALANQSLNYLVSGEAPHRHGTAHPNIVPYQAFATADGHLMLAIGNDRQFARFCAVAGCRELAADPRYATNALRLQHRQLLVPLLRAVLSSRNTGEWMSLLATANIPCGPINDLAQVFAEPQVAHRELKMSLPHATGSAPGVRNPIRYSRTAVEYDRSAPLLGEHTDAVLAERLGLGPQELRTLRDRGVVK